MMDRAANLRPKHFKHCQRNLADDESGFLKNGQLPETNIDEFLMLMRIMGIDEKVLKPVKNQGTHSEQEQSMAAD
jgi:hypothetical protein